MSGASVHVGNYDATGVNAAVRLAVMTFDVPQDRIHRISRRDLSAPWGVDLRDFEPGFCISVLEEQCWLRFPDETPIKLLPGDSLLVPRGRPGALLSSPKAETVAIWDLPWRGMISTDSIPTTSRLRPSKSPGVAEVTAAGWWA